MSTQNMYVESKYIKVFPAGFRSLQYAEAKLTTESNLLALRMISSSKKNNCQIFTHPNDPNMLVIIINGYYFEIIKANVPTSKENGKPVYAYIVTRDGNIKTVLANAHDSSIPALDETVDGTPLFRGLAFTNSVPLDNDGFIIVRDADGNIVEQKLKYSSDEIRDSLLNSSNSIAEHFTTETLKVDRIQKKDSSLIKFDNKFKVTDDSNDYDVEIAGNVSIKNNFTNNVPVTFGEATNSGEIKIKTSGNNPGTLVIKSGETLILPGNSNISNSLLRQTTSGTSSWIQYSKTNIANTIVQRDNNDIKSTTFNGITLNKNANGYIQLSSTVSALQLAGKMEVNSDGALIIGPYSSSPDANNEKISISNTFKSNSTVNIKGNMTINAPLTVGDAAGAVQISSSDANPTSIIGPGNGIIYLPPSTSIPIDASASYVWAQTRSSNNAFTNNWIKISAVTGTPNSLVMTDASGNINAQVSGGSEGATQVKQSPNASNNSYPILLSTDTVEAIRTPVFSSRALINPSTGAITAGTVNNLSLTNQNIGFKIAGGSNKYIQVNENAIINSPLTVGSTTTGEVKIRSAGANATTIIGPNNNTINLPANATTGNSLFRQATAGVPSWIQYSTEPTSNTIVQRMGDGSIKCTNLVISNSYNAVKAVKVNSEGQLVPNDLTTPTPTLSTGNNNPAFIREIAQDSTGKISAKIVNIEDAKTDAGGVIKVASVKQSEVGVNSLTSDSARYYSIELNANGKAIVNVPWKNTEYSAANGIKLVGTTFQTFQHTNSITAGTAKGSDTKALAFGDTFTIPLITYDAQGHITGKSVTTMTMPANPIDTKNTAGATNSSSKLFLIGATSQSANPQTYSHDTVYVDANGYLYSGGTKVSVVGHTHNYASPSHTHDITLAADSGTSTITLSHGSKYKLTAGGKSIIFTMPSDNDSKAASGNTSSKIFLIGVTRQSTSGQTTYSHDTTYVDDNACLHSTSFSATSDARLKTNIKKYECKKSILDLPIYKFDFIDGPKNRIGCLAQDLQKICPEIVHEDDETGYLSIEESKLVYLLLQEVKQLKEELRELKGE